MCHRLKCCTTPPTYVRSLRDAAPSKWSFTSTKKSPPTCSRKSSRGTRKLKPKSSLLRYNICSTFCRTTREACNQTHLRTASTGSSSFRPKHTAPCQQETRSTHRSIVCTDGWSQPLPGRYGLEVSVLGLIAGMMRYNGAEALKAIIETSGLDASWVCCASAEGGAVCVSSRPEPLPCSSPMLKTFLREKQMLLLLDNFEQV